jgi:hypothetical protein
VHIRASDQITLNRMFEEHYGVKLKSGRNATKQLCEDMCSHDFEGHPQEFAEFFGCSLPNRRMLTRDRHDQWVEKATLFFLQLGLEEKKREKKAC